MISFARLKAREESANEKEGTPAERREEALRVVKSLTKRGYRLKANKEHGTIVYLPGISGSDLFLVAWIKEFREEIIDVLLERVSKGVKE